MIRSYLEEKLFPRFSASSLKYIDIGPGWYELVSDLHDDLVEIDPDYLLFQVKEKFGTLRFYAELSQEMYDSASDSEKSSSEIMQKFEKIIGEYEHGSSFICEECSHYGRLTGGPWLKTLCRKCESQEDITDE